MWPMGLLFLKTSPVKEYSYVKDFSFLVLFVVVVVPRFWDLCQRKTGILCNPGGGGTRYLNG